MRKAVLSLVVLGFAGALWAQSPFDGVWKSNKVKIQNPSLGKPWAWAIENGAYQCTVCPANEGSVTIKADGADQPVTVSEDFNTQAVKIIDEKTIEISYKQDGDLFIFVKATVADDGKTYTAEQKNYTEDGKPPVVIEGTAIRLAERPAGSHAISGSWRVISQNVSLPDSLTVILKSSPNGLMRSSPEGELFDIKLNGKDYPPKHSLPGFTISLTRVNEREIDQTVKQYGKIVSMTHMTVSDDGNTLTLIEEDKEQGVTTTTIATKQ
jgi:hypothetical protein